MNAVDDTRDRVIRLEARFEAMSEKMDGMGEKVVEIHDVVTQARGAKSLARFLLAGGVGGLISTKLAWLFPWMGGNG